MHVSTWFRSSRGVGLVEKLRTPMLLNGGIGFSSCWSFLGAPGFRSGWCVPVALGAGQIGVIIVCSGLCSNWRVTFFAELRTHWLFFGCSRLRQDRQFAFCAMCCSSRLRIVCDWIDTSRLIYGCPGFLPYGGIFVASRDGSHRCVLVRARLPAPRIFSFAPGLCSTRKFVGNSICCTYGCFVVSLGLFAHGCVTFTQEYGSSWQCLVYRRFSPPRCFISSTCVRTWREIIVG